jgi:hypothetical protein
MNSDSDKLKKANDIKEALFGEDAKLKAFKENSERPTAELINEAQNMIEKGQTYDILIPQGQILYIDGVPFIAVKIKEKVLTLRAMAGYRLKPDTPANRRIVGYVEDGNKEEN